MPYKHSESRRHKFTKPKYKVANWPEYNDALCQRGDFTIWVTEEAVEQWYQEKHDVPARRTWRKLHLVVDENHPILACELTTPEVGDPTAVPDLLAQIDAPFEVFMGEQRLRWCACVHGRAGQATRCQSDCSAAQISSAFGGRRHSA